MSLKCRNEFCSMNQVLIKEDKFSFLEIGEGQPIVLLHGLMGGLSNFEGILNFFPHGVLPHGIEVEFLNAILRD